MTNLNPERRAELRGLAESTQPFTRHGGTDPAAVYVPAAELTALLDAADERDRLAAQVEAVLTLHSQSSYLTYCRADGEKYPCPTVDAIAAALGIEADGTVVSGE